MKLTLLDRDGVVVVNRPTNLKSPAELTLLEGAAEAVATLNAAGYTVAICTNQPEVGRGVMSAAQLDEVHRALTSTLKAQGAVVDRIFSCTSLRRCPGRKPSPGMLREAIAVYEAQPRETYFIGDQADDLKAGFHAGCRRILVKTGLGRKALATGLPDYLQPFEVCDDLRAAAEIIARRSR